MNVYPRTTRPFRALARAPALALCCLAMPMANASQVVMFWDRPGPYETLNGIEASGGLEVPAEACGFRLGRHGETWQGGWHFGTHGNQG